MKPDAEIARFGCGPLWIREQRPKKAFSDASLLVGAIEVWGDIDASTTRSSDGR
jgi:hypothetical protein